VSQTPLISIITPTKDRRDLLEMTIRSVRNQTYANFEHIVVDGSSTDGTVELLGDLEGTYPMRWVSESDPGMYHAINKGLRMARGEIVAYLNSDDLYFPWTLEVVANAFARRPWADLLYGDALNIDDETGNVRLYWMPPFELDYVRRFRCLLQPVVFWRREVMDRIGYFDESIKLVADCDYWMRAGEVCRFGKINEFLAVERDHATTLREVTARAAGSDRPRGSDAGFRDELEQVRARYVALSGELHEQAVKRHLRRARLWDKAYGLAFGLQAFIAPAIRRGPWSRLLVSGEPKVSRIKFLLSLVPRFGRRFRGRAIAPNRYWLVPATPGSAANARQAP
jgi:glycosyltransferase involved in cell wall biosynthesis